MTWTVDGFVTETEGDYNEAMTIYDVLCNSKENCMASGTFCQTNMLRDTVQSANLGGNFFQKTADQLAGNVQKLEKAL